MSIESFIEKICVQTAVYWGAPTPDGYGKMTYDPPREIKCRWEDKTEVITGGDGQQIISSASIIVMEDLDYQGVLFLGSLDELTTAEEADPLTLMGITNMRAYHILRVEKVPMIKSDSVFVRKVYL